MSWVGIRVEGGIIRVAGGWAANPLVDKGMKQSGELGPVVSDLLAKSRPPVSRSMGASYLRRERELRARFRPFSPWLHVRQVEGGFANHDRDRAVGQDW